MKRSGYDYLAASQPTSKPKVDVPRHIVRYQHNGVTVEIRCFSAKSAEREAMHFRALGYAVEVRS